MRDSSCGRSQRAPFSVHRHPNQGLHQLLGVRPFLRKSDIVDMFPGHQAGLVGFIGFGPKCPALVQAATMVRTLECSKSNVWDAVQHKHHARYKSHGNQFTLLAL